MLCEKCSNWADTSGFIRILTDHHESCPNRPDITDSFIDVLDKIIFGIECWAEDEDGVHPEVFDHYKKGKLIIDNYKAIKKTKQGEGINGTRSCG